MPEKTYTEEKKIGEKLIRSIRKNKLNIKVKLILGPATQFNREEEFSNDHNHLISIAQSTDDMLKEIQNAEFGLCSGGLTSYEFASQKIPFGIICQHSHQLSTAKEWKKKGVAENLGVVSQKTEKKIVSFLKSILVNKMLKKKNLVDGMGAKRVVSEIFGLSN